MLVDYPCAMQKKNHYWRREGDLYKYVITIATVFLIFAEVLLAAPTSYDNSLPQSQSGEIAEYFSEINGCYYNFQRYEEGDRIITNEPCLNCTCHNRMLMCYLRVCPFTKAIGQDCTIEKKPDQCCPIITCPEVPVKLLTSSTTSSPAPTTSTTEIGFHDNYGCTIHNSFYADGAQVPSDPKKPCELCYCIRNRTACVMQECTLHVEGCKPVFQEGVCCPVRYECDYDKEIASTPFYDSTGGLVKTTTSSAILDCRYNNEVYYDGESITTEKPCEHCYCMRGEIVCAVQDCGEPLRGKDCVPTMPPPEKCCPSSYACANETTSTEEVTRFPDVLTTTEFESKTTIFHSKEDQYVKLGETTSAPTSTAAAAHPSNDVPVNDEAANGDDHVDDSVVTEPHEPSSYTTAEAEHAPSSEKPLAYPESDDHNVETTNAGTTAAEISTEKTLNKVDGSFSVRSSSEAPVASTNTATTQAVETTVAEKVEYSSPASDEHESDASSGSEEVPGGTESVTTLEPSTRYSSTQYVTEVKDRVTTEPSSDEGVTTEAPVASDETSDTTQTPYSYAKVTAASEKESSVDSEENSSEPNRFQSTTRQFDNEKNTVAFDKESAETTRAPVTEENIQTTVGTISETSASADEINKEGFTENINTVSTDSTSSLLENITKIIHSIQASQNNSLNQMTNVETTKQPYYTQTEAKVTEKSDVYATVTDRITEVTSSSKEEITTVSPSVIPGEGSCLVDGITYSNTSVIESNNPCHSKCICLSSIPTCTLVTCAPPPDHPHCVPIQVKPESCCPDYVCSNNSDQGIAIIPLPGVDSQMIGTDEPERSTPIPEEAAATTIESKPEKRPIETSSQEYSKSTEIPFIPSKPEKEFSDAPEYTTAKESAENGATESSKPEYITEKNTAGSTVAENGKPEEVVTETSRPEDASTESKSPEHVTSSPASDETEPKTTTYMPSYSSSEGQETESSVTEQTAASTSTEEHGGSSSESSYASDEHTTEKLEQTADGDEGKPTETNGIGESTPAGQKTTEEFATTTAHYAEESHPSDGADEQVSHDSVVTTEAAVQQDITSLSTEKESQVDVTTVSTPVEDGSLLDNEVKGEETPDVITTTPAEGASYSTLGASSESSPPSESEYTELVTNAPATDAPTTLFYSSTAGPQETNDVANTETPETNVPEHEPPTTYKPEPEDNEENIITTVIPMESSSHGSVPEITTVNEQSAASSEEPAQSPEPSHTTEAAQEAEVTDKPVYQPEPQHTPETTTAAEEIVTTEASVETQTEASHPPAHSSTSTERQPSNEGKHTEPAAPTTTEQAEEEPTKIPEPAKPITILPEQPNHSAFTVLPSKGDYTTLVPSAHENYPTEPSPETEPTPPPVSSQDTPTNPPETNEIPQHPVSAGTTGRPDLLLTEPYTDSPFKAPSSEVSSTSSSTTESLPAVTQPDIQHSTWTRKPAEEETSESNYYPPAPMYPTGGSETTGTESGHEESEYEDSAFGPGTCRYGGKIYVSAQQIPRDDPCDFCFCFRSDIICLQQSCPPPIQGCRQEPIQGFCCPRYECPVATSVTYNVTTSTSTTTSTTTTLPPYFPSESYRGIRRNGCMIHGYFYKVGEDIAIASGPCLECICGSDGRMKCDPKSCSPEPFLRQIMAEATSNR